MQKVHIITLGCKVNQFESAALLSAFARQEVEICHNSSDADIIIINTCSVTGRAGSQSRNAARKAARENTSAKIVVTGCYSQLEAEVFRNMEELAGRELLLVGNQHKDQLVKSCLHPADSSTDLIGDIRSHKKITDLHVDTFSGRTRAYLRIQDGCDAFCSYCIVPYTRGPSRSLSYTKILAQVHTYQHLGYNEIVLTGIHAGYYGKDLKENIDITGLIDRLCSETPNIRYRLSSIEPIEVSDALLALFNKHPNFQHHLHIPLQSGCDSVLERMHRRYTTDEFAGIITACHDAVADIAIGIDVLAGFPGETDEEFEQTFRFLSTLHYTYLHVFPYSLRPGTVAASLPDHLAKSIKDQRVKQLRELSEQKRSHFYSRFIGQIRPVLIENKQDADGKLKGFTDNYIPVLIEGNDAMTNTIQYVRLTRQNKTTIYGEKTTSHAR